MRECPHCQISLSWVRGNRRCEICGFRAALIPNGAVLYLAALGGLTWYGWP